jgi:ribosomal-protein-alanine N-acetyltransferase
MVRLSRARAVPLVLLERPSGRRRDEFLAAVRRSRALHRPWIEPPATPAAFDAYLRRCRGRAFRGLFVVVAATRELAGVVNVSEIVRGHFQSAYLGYYALAPFARRGLMTEGLGLVVDHAFTALGLHRLEANVQPANAASRRLVRRLGFRREGLSPRYLEVGGRWRDHERWAILDEDWRRRPTASPSVGAL